MSHKLLGILSVFVESPFREGLVCVITIPAVLFGAYQIASFTGNWFYIHIGLTIAVLLLIWPIWIGIGIFLLWKNPAKYKEYGMKKRMRERREQEEKIDND